MDIFVKNWWLPYNRTTVFYGASFFYLIFQTILLLLFMGRLWRVFVLCFHGDGVLYCLALVVGVVMLDDKLKPCLDTLMPQHLYHDACITFINFIQVVIHMHTC
ncbi:hypothetical protein ACJX0J_015402 [Zea mays]